MNFLTLIFVVRMLFVCWSNFSIRRFPWWWNL